MKDLAVAHLASCDTGDEFVQAEELAQHTEKFAGELKQLLGPGARDKKDLSFGHPGHTREANSAGEDAGRSLVLRRFFCWVHGSDSLLKSASKWWFEGKTNIKAILRTIQMFALGNAVVWVARINGSKKPTDWTKSCGS